MSTRIGNPFPYFTDKAGRPLTGGSVYIGTSGNDPELSPVDVFTDVGLTSQVEQPISTIGGLLTYNGNPFQFYIAESGYSIRIYDENGAQVDYTTVAIPGVTDFQPLDATLTAIAALADTAFGRGFLTLADGPAAKTYIGVNEQNPLEFISVAVTDETTAFTAGTGKLTFRMPYAFTLTAVKASLTTAQTGGSLLTVDLNEGGASILSTKLTFDNGEKTTTTAAAQPVISDAALADDAEMTIDIDTVGDGTARGLKVYLIGRRT